MDLSNITKTDANVFNHYSIKYSSSIYIKGVITYNMSNGKLDLKDILKINKYRLGKIDSLR